MKIYQTLVLIAIILCSNFDVGQCDSPPQKTGAATILGSAVVWSLGGILYGAVFGAGGCEYCTTADCACTLERGLYGATLGLAVMLPTGIYLASRHGHETPRTKNPGLPAVISPLIPGSGHAYAGNWWRGLAFAALRIALYNIAVEYGDENGYQDDEGYYYDPPPESLFFVCIAGMLAVTVWEVIDASDKVAEYNKRAAALGETANQNAFTLGFQISPKGSYGMTLRYLF